MRCNVVLLIIFVLFVSSCHKKPDSSTVVVKASSCSPTDGCYVRFAAGTSQSSAPVDTGWQISKITIHDASELLNKGDTQSDSNITWINNPLPCTLSGSVVTCPNFMFISTDFTLTGVIDGQTITQRFKYKNNIKPSKHFVECGDFQTSLNPTTYQRMFDCSKRVVRYGGFANIVNLTTVVVGPADLPAPVPPNQQYSHDNDSDDPIEVLFDQSFTTCYLTPSACDPDLNWFLVSCAKTGGSENCFWLSPVLKADNPSVGPNEYTSMLVPMSQYMGGRILWSAVSTGNYNFFEANGYAPLGLLGPSPIPQIPNFYAYYILYPLDDYDDVAFTQNPAGPGGLNFTVNPIVLNVLQSCPLSLPSSPPFQCIDPGRCVEGPCPLPTPPFDPGSIYANTALYATTPNQYSLCDPSRTTNDPVLLPSSVYEWQIPSYPMILSLAGGYLCKQAPDIQVACNPQGFRATSLGGGIPHFADLFWSSSGADTDSGWLFVGEETAANPQLLDPGSVYGLASNFLYFYPFQVRCASLTW